MVALMWLRGPGVSRPTIRVIVGLALVLGVVAQGSGSASALPDGRQWELVSPPNTNGALISAMEIEGGVAQAATAGGAFTWAASAPIGAEPAGSRVLEWSQIFSTRGADGWSSRDVAGPHEAATGLIVGDKSEYRLFSSDLSLGLVEPKGETPLSPEASERTLYLRDDAGSDFLALVTKANVPAGAKFGGREELGGEKGLTFRGAAPDLSHIVFSFLGNPLTPDAITGENLYEWAGGRLQLVSVLPEREGGMAAATPQLGNQDADVRQAISGDGSRIAWTTGRGTDSERLYLRDMTKQETVRLDVAQGAREPARAAAQYQTAGEDDQSVFFTDTQRLTADSTTPANGENSQPDLYVFETTNDEDEALKGTLTDLTVDHNAGESADVQGLLPGASEDGSYVYLVAKGVLSEAENAEQEKAVPGAYNLYVSHDTGAGWTTTFIAQLSGEDAHDWTGTTLSSTNGESKEVELAGLTSRVSPDGGYLAFMSERELTGYDNHDANSGTPDEEVFLYDASTERLICASCNPNPNVRPVGVQDEGRSAADPDGRLLVDEAGLWGGGRWLAGSIPGWTPVNNAGAAFYQSRYLSDSGRLFFNSSDALVPEDSDGTEDVYEYEPVGVGSCGSGASSRSQLYKPARGFEVEGRKGEEPPGCVGLISSGSSAEESVFLDAGENGGDVFFLTTAKLVPQDVQTSLAVYDAHECTTRSPCVAPPAGAAAECTSADGCRAPPTPQPPIFGLPPSATFSGAGNSAPARSVKPLTRAQELTKALTACRKKPKTKKKEQKKQQRAACEKRARDEYRPPAKAKKTSRVRK